MSCTSPSSAECSNIVPAGTILIKWLDGKICRNYATHCLIKISLCQLSFSALRKAMISLI